MTEALRIEPRDEANQSLLANAHPDGWRNPTPSGRYNLVVIGAGTAGLVAAAGAAALGAKVAIVEKAFMGGDCLNFGCVPSKAIIRSARLASDVAGAAGYGVVVPPGTTVDFAAVMERMRRLRARISVHDSAERFRKLGAEVFLGEAHFTARDAVEVGGATLRFAKAIVATGARAARPDVPGLAEAGYLTNETVFSLVERPKRLAVIGAGPLGCELAQAFARLGCEVEIIQRGPTLLPREDPDATRILAEALARDGVKARTGTVVSRVTVEGGRKVLQLQAGGASEAAVFDEILVGIGRAPNVEGLNLEAAGVEYDAKTGVKVDDFLRTTNPNIFAAGDACLKEKFTHTADASARVALRNALFWGRQRWSRQVIPWCTYTDPEIAHVGLYEHEAKERGIPVVAYKRELSEVDRAVLDSEENGFAKIIVHGKSGLILGATVVAAHAGEIISEMTAAIVGGMKIGQLATVIHAYPTQAEALKGAADESNRARLTERARKILAWLMKVRR
jgi:pyruvate/2-oxoglutarate dehydrogenase complex dihydrolipoamide dehydrogenase (E3) component